jgi:glyoxylase-like metal-dependent hydrolase (beta-lactamase superfamily II)
MMRSRWILLALILALGVASMLAMPAQSPAGGGPPPGTNYTRPAFTFNKIADGVYHAVGTGSLIVMSNAAVIEGDREVLVVDSHVSPGGAWALREELKAITPKPIRYVVNSHYHFDHSHGNQIYGPEVQIIGHEFAREMILAGKSQDSRAREFFVGSVPGQIDALKQRIASLTDIGEKTKLERQLTIQQNHLEGTNAVRPTPPNVTLNDRMTLHLGGREVRIMFMGRGHTAGDVVVFLPKERVIATGDLLTEGTSYAGDAYVPEWIETLEKVKALDFDTVLPGHGTSFKGKAKIDHFQAYLRLLWSEAKRMHDAGIPMEEAARTIDLRSQAVNYPAIRTAGLTPPHGVWRVYELLDGKAK